MKVKREDDEEIDSDEAFGEEDMEKYGTFKTKKNRAEEEEEEEEEVRERRFSMFPFLLSFFFSLIPSLPGQR